MHHASHIGRVWLILAGCLAASLPSVAEPPDTNYDESKVPAYTLPDPLVMADGSAVSDALQWHSQRRPEILKLFRTHIYGATPSRPQPVLRTETRELNREALDGRATRKQVRIHFGPGETPAMDLLLYVPNRVSGQVPAFLGLNFYGNHTVHDDPGIEINPNWMRSNEKIGIVNHRATEKTRGVYAHRWQVEKIIDRGYALVTLYYGDIDPDNYQDDFSDGVHPLFYKKGQTQPAADEWGAIGAWAWGLSRALDFLQNDRLIDARRVAVIGHSRLGKTALWAGAQDQRFALVISNNSGCGGAALFRRCFGERIHHMTEGRIGYWFCENIRRFARKEADLPVDQHQLIALIAPRPVYIASAEKDRWADPRGEFLSAVHATPVYRLFDREGLPAQTMPGLDEPVHGTIGYHIRSGSHDVTAYDWQQYLTFADEHLRSAEPEE